MWKIIRIFILLMILATVLQQSISDKADLDWKDNFYVALYPINADGSNEVAGYIRTLTKEDFVAIEDYFAEEGKRYHLAMRQPVATQLGAMVDDNPPVPPEAGVSGFDVLLWSLKFRWFAWNNSPKVPVKPDIRLYLLYYNPATSPKLAHSTALDKGRIGRVNLFGDKTYTKQNLVVISHELLHTLSATDKYDLNTGFPIYPDGYAEPDKKPRYPQTYAELMGGYVPINEAKNEIPNSLQQTLIGEKTAYEIGWVK
jgi:hypothetical protein